MFSITAHRLAARPANTQTRILRVLSALVLGAGLIAAAIITGAVSTSGTTSMPQQTGASAPLAGGPAETMAPVPALTTATGEPPALLIGILIGGAITGGGLLLVSQLRWETQFARSEHQWRAAMNLT